MAKTTVNDIKRGPIANCIVLHDFVEKESDVKGWFEYTVDFFEKHDLRPNRCSGTKKNKTNISFKKACERLEEENFNIETLWIGAVPPNHDNDIADAIFSTYLEARVSEKNKTLVLCFDDQIVSFMPEQVNQLASDLSSFFKFRYGYCYQRSFKKGPIWYPFGVCVGTDDDDPEEDLLTKWSNAYHMSDGKYKTGDLRDIYPMNLLSKAHQQHTVEGLPFFDWIQADAARGELMQLKEDLWAWWVDPSTIPAVREALRPTGWVIAI